MRVTHGGGLTPSPGLHAGAPVTRTPWYLALVLSLSTVVACKDDGNQFADAGVDDAAALDAEVDGTAPETTIAAAPPALSNAAEVSFTFEADEDASFECRVDDGAFAACTSPHAVTVADGAHTFEVRAIDLTGNVDETPAAHTWTTDTVAPDTTITAAPPALDNSTEVSVAFTADEAGTYECRLDGGAWAPCTPPHALTGLADGAHTFEVRATDAAGNVDATPASHTWTIDSTTPDTAIDTGPSGAVASTSASFTFSSPDAGAGATYECRLDGGAWAACTSPRALSGLAQGAHTFEVRVEDAVGNVDPTPASRTWTVDTIAPDTTITAGPSGATASNDPSFSFTGETGATFQCRLDGASFAACTSPQAYSDVAEGAHTFAVRACDAVGNCDATPASRSFTVDTLPPDTAITSGPSGLTNNNDPSFAFTGESGATFQCRLDGASFAACTSPQAFANVADGAHTFEVRACDAVGNCDPTPASRGFTVDTAPPDTTITSGPSGASNNNDPSFAFTGEAGATFQCRLGAASFAACTSPHAYTNVADGAHTFEVRACDAAGNCDPSPASRSFSVDTAAPNTTITSGPSGTTNDNDPSFGFSGEAGATFQCRLDGASFATCTSPLAFTNVADGAHTFEVRACDAVGNCDPSPASRGFTVDTTPPDTTITSGPSGTTNNNDPSFGFSAEAGATFQCRLGAASFAACTSPQAYTNLADGAHTFEVRACDAVGNCDASPASRGFTVDTAAPDTAITSGPSGTTSNNDPSFAFSSEPGATFQCRLDAASFAACTSPHAYANVADGAHTFQVRACDAAGNCDPSPAARTWTIDTTAPNTFLSTLVGDPWPVSYADFSISHDGSTGFSRFECRLDGGAWNTCAASTSVDVGYYVAHTFQARACDTANNCDASPASVTWTPIPGLVAYLPLDGDILNTTRLGADHDGVANISYVTGEIGLAGRVDDGGLLVQGSPRPMSTSPDGGYTIATWLFFTGSHRVLDFAGETGCYVETNADQVVVCCVGPSGEFCDGSQPGLPQQGYVHLALVSEPGSGDVYLHVDGQERVMLSNIGDDWWNEAAMELSVARGSSYAEVDDLRLYNRALSFSEICTLAGGNDGDGCFGVGPELELRADGGWVNTGSWGATAVRDGGGFVEAPIGMGMRSAAPDAIFLRGLGGESLYWANDVLVELWLLDETPGEDAIVMDMRCDEGECQGGGGVLVAETSNGLVVCYSAFPEGESCTELEAEPGAWHHLAIRAKQDTGGQQTVTSSILLYLDGRPIVEMDPPAGAGVFELFPPFAYFNGYAAQHAVPAVVDEIRLWASYVPDELICARALRSWDGATCN